MAKGLDTVRDQLADNAPQMEIIKVPEDKIREVIGSGGKVIRGIVDESGAKVNIDDDGTVQVSATDRESIDKALQMIKEIVAEPEVGEIYRRQSRLDQGFRRLREFLRPERRSGARVANGE